MDLEQLEDLFNTDGRNTKTLKLINVELHAI